MKLIQKLSLMGMVWGLFACGPSNDVPTAASPITPSGDPVNRSQLAPVVNSIAGSWTIYSIVTTRTDTDYQNFRESIFNHRDAHGDVNVQMHLQVIDHGARAATTIVSANLRDGSCSVQFSFDQIYCCPEMLRVTWLRNSHVPQEVPMGCALNTFGMSPQEMKEMITAGLIGSPTSRMPSIYHFTPMEPVIPINFVEAGWEENYADRRWILLQNPAPDSTGQPISDLQTRIELVED